MTADRFRHVAAGFTARAQGVAPGAWDNPSPCTGWLARDVVRHLVEWVPAFFQEAAGLQLPAGPSVDEDPAAAWGALAGGLQAALDDPAVAQQSFTHPQLGPQIVESAVAMIVIGDVLVHTWDLARSTGQDETLDADEVHRMYVGMEPMDEALRASGHFGPRVPVPDDADEQTRLLAFVGRQT